MKPRFFLLILAGTWVACSRSAPPSAAVPAPAPPLVAQPTEPPKPAPVQLGEAPRMKEE